MTDLFIWIVRWGDFQHYKPERDRAPAWIKTYTKQLDDDRYTDLTPRRRALLHDLRTAFARTSGRLSRDTRVLSRRLLTQVFRADLDALNHAGFIEIVSRDVLEQRLEKLYASRAPARSKDEEREVEVEQEEEKAFQPAVVQNGAGRQEQELAGIDHDQDIPF